MSLVIDRSTRVAEHVDYDTRWEISTSNSIVSTQISTFSPIHNFCISKSPIKPHIFSLLRNSYTTTSPIITSRSLNSHSWQSKYFLAPPGNIQNLGRIYIIFWKGKDAWKIPVDVSSLAYHGESTCLNSLFRCKLKVESILFSIT